MPDENKLNAAIDAAESTALGSDGTVGDLSVERAKAIDAFAGVNISPAPEGRSQVTDRTVFETIQWILPSLTRIFANGDNVVEFAPTGPEDEEAAEQESDYLNYLVTQKNNWFLTLVTWFQDALLTKNAYCMAYIEERLKTETSQYKGQSEESLALLLEEEGVEVVEGSSYPDPEDPGSLVDSQTGQEIPAEMAEQAMMQGVQVIQVPPRNLYDVSIKKTTPTKRLQFKVLPPERCKVDGDTPDFTTENCNYFEYYEDVTISDLRADGYDVPDDISSGNESDTEEAEARDKYNDSETEGDSPDPSMRTVRARTIWIRFDYDEDGIAELQKVVRVGNTILEREEASRIPVASIVPFLHTHRHIGMSVADLTYDIQAVNTKLLRSMLDSMELSINPRHQISDKVHLDDMLISRPGSLVRLKDGSVPGEGHVMPIQTEFTAPQAMEGMRHMSTMVESRVGVNRIFQGIDESALNDHNRIGQLSTMAAQRVEQIARIFANGVEYLFSLAHELIIKSGHQSETTKLRGEWVTIDPSQWKTSRDMRVVAPFSAGNKDSLLQRLMVLKNIHAEALASGLPIVTPEDSYELALEISKSADVMGEKFFTDPKVIPPPPESPDYTMMALEIENKKADNAAQDSSVDSEIAKYKTDTDAALDKYRADLQASTQIEIARMNALKALDVEILKQEGNSEGPSSIQALANSVAMLNERLTGQKEVVRDDMGNVVALRGGDPVSSEGKPFATGEALEMLMRNFEQLQTRVSTPKELVKDENGRVIGVREGDVTRNVIRDEEGRVVGLE
jgi:hypothetical protein